MAEIATPTLAGGTGTIFEHTKLPLRAWFLGFHLAQLGKSTATIAQELPCDYHTAHRIVWVVREAVGESQPR